MKRSPLQRHTPLRRSGSLKRSWIKRKKARRIEKRKHLRPYLAYVAQRPCAGELGIYIEGRGWREHYCSGPIQVMHLGIKPGVGLKCSDLETGAGCLQLHTDFDQHNGPFRGLSRDERRVWAEKVIADTQLGAVPETLDQAREFERRGLGVIEAREGGSFTWTPVGATT